MPRRGYGQGARRPGVVQVGVPERNSCPEPVPEDVQDIIPRRPAVDQLDGGDLVPDQEKCGREVGREDDPAVVEPTRDDPLSPSQPVRVEQERGTAIFGKIDRFQCSAACKSAGSNNVAGTTSGTTSSRNREGVGQALNSGTGRYPRRASSRPSPTDSRPGRSTTTRGATRLRPIERKPDLGHVDVRQPLNRVEMGKQDRLGPGRPTSIRRSPDLENTSAVHGEPSTGFVYSATWSTATSIALKLISGDEAILPKIPAARPSIV